MRTTAAASVCVGLLLATVAVRAIAGAPSGTTPVVKATAQAPRRVAEPKPASAAPPISSNTAAAKKPAAPPPSKASAAPLAPDVLPPVSPARPPLSVTPIPTARFCPTSGRVDPLGPFAMHVDLGGMRGVIAGDASTAAELGFTYRGKSAETKPLGSGEIRRQVGLRLRAQDTCNAVYVMWHIEPTPRIAVSVKRNPGMSTHAQCLDNGYINVRPASEAPRAAIVVGVPHTLRAELDGREMKVTTDGVVTWSGTLPAEAEQLHGPAGIRTDNVALDFELRVPDGAKGQVGCAGVIRD